MSSESNKIIENLKEAYDTLQDAIEKNKLTKRDFERIKFEINGISSLVDDNDKSESYELNLYKDALKGILQSYNNVLYDVMVGIICNVNKKYEFDDEIILEWKINLTRYLELNHLLNGFKDYGFYPSDDTGGKFKRININLIKNIIMYAFDNLYNNKLLESKEIFKNGYNLENLIEDIRSSESYKDAIVWDVNLDLNDNIMKNAISRIS